MDSGSRSTNFVLLFVAVYLFTKVWPRIRAFVIFWRMRLTANQYVLAEQPSSSQPVRAVLEAAAHDLELLGFEYQFSFDCTSGKAVIRMDYHSRADAPGSYALVQAPALPAVRPYDLFLQTRFRSDAGEEFEVGTVGGVEILPVDEATAAHVEYFGAATAIDLWHEHQRRVEEYEAAGNQRIMEDEGVTFIDGAEKESEELMQESLKNGKFVLNKDGSYRLSAAAALAAQKSTRSSITPLRAVSLESAAPDEPAAMRLEAARCSLTRSAKEDSSPPGYLILFAFSFVAFFIAFWVWLGWRTTVILTVVIFVHELGHLLGMKLCGYRHARIFFVPMLGGVAMGKKSNPTPVQEMIVILLGPVPGLLIGIGAIWAYSEMDAPKWLLHFASIALAINYLNLLPVMPLDGGRIVSTLFMRRFPLLQFVFSVLSAAALAIGAFYLKSPLLGLFAFFGLLRLRVEWSNGIVEKAVLPHLTSASPDPDETTLLVVQAMRAKALPQCQLPLATRITLVNQIVAAVARTKASVGVMVAGSCVYALCLVVPVVVFFAVK